MAKDCRPAAITPHAKGEKQCKLVGRAIVDGPSSRDDLGLVRDTIGGIS